MANFNKVILAGNLTRDIELRHLPSNVPVGSFGLAVNEKWKDKQSGEWVERANFVDCEAFGKSAEILAQYASKGSPLLVEGKLRFEQWDDKQSGQKRSKLKVVVETFQFLGGGERQTAKPVSSPTAGGGPIHDPVADDDIPFLPDPIGGFGW